MSKRKENAPAANGRSTADRTSSAQPDKAQTGLRAIESELRQLEDELFTLGKTALQKALRYGELLYQAKALLKHGEWLPWLKEHVRFSQPAAWHYMKLYQRRDDPELVKLLKFNNLAGVTAAYQALGLPGGGEPSPDELNPVRRKSERAMADEEDTTYLLSLSEGGIIYFIEAITAPDASPMNLELWEILVREVNRKLKELAKGGRQ
jgi:hypothetical protein